VTGERGSLEQQKAAAEARAVELQRQIDALRVQIEDGERARGATLVCRDLTAPASHGQLRPAW